MMRKIALASAAALGFAALGLVIGIPAVANDAGATFLARGEAVVNDQNVADVTQAPAMLLATGEAFVNDQNAHYASLSGEGTTAQG